MEFRWLMWRLLGIWYWYLHVYGVLVYYRIPNSAFGLCLMRWDEGPLLCAVPVWSLLWLWSIGYISCYEHCNVTVYSWVSLLYITGITCHMSIYILLYKLSCALCRGNVVVCFIIVFQYLYSVRGWRVIMSGMMVWSFQRGAWVLESQWVWGFMVGGVLAGLQRFYLGIWSVRHLGGCF